jgi:hypothetical protein
MKNRYTINATDLYYGTRYTTQLRKIITSIVIIWQQYYYYNNNGNVD